MAKNYKETTTQAAVLRTSTKTLSFWCNIREAPLERFAELIEGNIRIALQDFSGGATLTASTGSIAKDNEKGTTITKAGSVATGDTTPIGILMALAAGSFGVLEETVRRKKRQ